MPILYIDETWISHNHRCGVKIHMNKDKRIIILQAESKKTEFLNGIKTGS